MATYMSNRNLTRRLQRRVIVASAVGNGLEFFEASVFGALAGLYINKLFFPQFDPVVGFLAAAFTFGLGFVARPVGALIFGHFGDRVGRKATLIATLSIMGGATFCMGLVPPYAVIGIWGAVLLSLFRVIQGLALGGEWGGATLLVAEWVDQRHRGLWCAFPNLGVVIGNGLGYVVLLIVPTLIPDPNWAFRVPLLLSIVLVAIGLYIRLGIYDTPAFAKLLEERRVERWPSLTALWQDKRQWFTAWMMRMGDQSTSTLINTFVIAYATTLVLHLPPSQILGTLLLCAVVALFAIPFFGWLSDRIGRRLVYGAGALLIAAWAIPYWMLVSTRDPLLIVLASLVAWLTWSMLAGPQAALFAEMFTRRRRYSGISLGYQLSGLTAGAPVLFIAGALVRSFQGAAPTALGVYTIIGAAISLIATLFAPDHQDEDLSAEYEEALVPGAQPAPLTT